MRQLLATLLMHAREFVRLYSQEHYIQVNLRLKYKQCGLNEDTFWDTCDQINHDYLQRNARFLSVESIINNDIEGGEDLFIKAGTVAKEINKIHQQQCTMVINTKTNITSFFLSILCALSHGSESRVYGCRCVCALSPTLCSCAEPWVMCVCVCWLYSLRPLSRGSRVYGCRCVCVLVVLSVDNIVFLSFCFSVFVLILCCSDG